jgi:hypothetical protein
MIDDVSPDGKDYPVPPWLISQRWAQRCLCFYVLECPIHGTERIPDCATICGPEFALQQAREGIEVEVTASPPPGVNEWIGAHICRHGRRFWIQPTDNQQVIWSRAITYGRGVTHGI